MGSPDSTAVGATLPPNTLGSYMPPIPQTPNKNAGGAEGTSNGRKHKRRNRNGGGTNSSKDTELKVIEKVSQPVLAQEASKPAVTLNAGEKSNSQETISAPVDEASPKDPPKETTEKCVTAPSSESSVISPSVKLFMQVFPDIASNASLDEASLKDALSAALEREEVEAIEEEVKSSYESKIKDLEAQTKALEEDKKVLRNQIIKLGEESLGKASEFSKDRELLKKIDADLKQKISEKEVLLEKIKNLEEVQKAKFEEHQEEIKALHSKLENFKEVVSQKEGKEANIRLARSLVTALGASLYKITDKETEKESDSVELTQEEVRIIIEDCNKKVEQLYKLLNIQKIDTLAPPKRTFKEWQDSIKKELNDLHREKGELEGTLDYIKRKLAEEKGSKNKLEFSDFGDAKRKWSTVVQTMIEKKKNFEEFFLALLDKVENGEERVSDVPMKAINSVSNALKGIGSDEIASRLEKQSDTHNSRYKLLETILLQWKGLEDSLNSHGNFILFNTLAFEKTEFTKEVREQLEELRKQFLDFSVIELPTLRQSFLMISLQYEVDSLRAFIGFAAQTRRYLRKIEAKELQSTYQLIKATFGELMRKKTILMPDVEILKNAIEEQVKKWEIDPVIPEKRLEQIAIILKMNPEQVKAMYYDPYLEEHRNRSHQLEAIQSNLSEYDQTDSTKSLWIAVQEVQRLHDACKRNGEHITETWFNRSPLVGGGIRDEEIDHWSIAYPLEEKKEAGKEKETESKGKEKDASLQRKGK